MAKDKFDWKGLFVNDEENDGVSSTKKAKSSSASSFPETNKASSKFPKDTPVAIKANDSVLSDVLKMYEKGFESLNQPGYDFFEFFKAVKAVGSNDPQVYKMAYTMGVGVDSKVNKDFLIEQSEFYVKEIEKVHLDYQVKGNAKKTQVQQIQKNKKEKLTIEVGNLEKKLLELQTQLSTKKNELQTIDTDLLTEVSKIDQTIAANDMAKTRILASIMGVVEGIRKNI